MTLLFTPKPFADITADQIERLRLVTDRITDFNVGSVVRSLIEANAVELDDYYQEVYLGLMRAIPTAIYLGFGFERRMATAARGLITLARVEGASDLADDLTAPSGTRLVNPAGIYFTTDSDLVIAGGETEASVTVTAETAGASGNSGPNSLVMVTEDPHLAMSHPGIISGGIDAESEEQRAQRFAFFILTLARGTLAALEYGATLPAIIHPVTGIISERVQRYAVYETPGHVQLFIHNGSYGASQELVAAVEAVINGYRDPETNTWEGGYRPAGMAVRVMVMTDRPVDVSLEVSSGIGFSQASLETAIRDGLAAWLRAAIAGQQVRPIDLINQALSVDGVLGATLLDPTQTLTVNASDVLYLRDLNLTWV